MQVLVSFFLFSSRRRHTISVSAFLLNRSSDLVVSQRESVKNDKPTISMSLSHCIHQTLNSKASTRFHSGGLRSEERFSRNAETDLVCRLLLEKKKIYLQPLHNTSHLQNPPEVLTSNNGIKLIVRLLVTTSSLFNDTATTEIYTLSLHDALPISANVRVSKTINQPSA